MAIADAPPPKIFETTSTSTTLGTSAKAGTLTTLDPEDNVLDPNFWGKDFSGVTDPPTTSTSTVTTTEELLTSPEYRGPPTLPGSETTISPLITFQAEGYCPDECKNGCPACNTVCRACSFCNPEAAGPFGKAAEYCKADVKASTKGQTLHWTVPPTHGKETVGTIEMEVRCRTPCFEVWFSNVPSFASYQTQIVRDTELALPEVEAFAYARVRALQYSEVSGEAAHSAWSNTIIWGDDSDEATIPPSSTVTTQTFTTATTVTVTTFTITTTATTLPAGLPTTMEPMWFLPEGQLPESPEKDGDQPDGIEATISFASTPQAVLGMSSVAKTQALQASLSSMLEVQTGKVKVLALRAAKVLLPRDQSQVSFTPSLRSRRLISMQHLTGEVQADFVVLCADAKERHTITAAIQAILLDESAKQRFVNAFKALSNSPVEVDSVQCAMVDREWSKAIEQRKSSSIQSDARVAKRSDMRRSFLGLHLTWVAAAVAVLLSLFTCLTCTSQTDPSAEKESEPFLSVQSDSEPGEPEKGAVPSGVLGFDPRNFNPEKYMSHKVTDRFSKGR